MDQFEGIRSLRAGRNDEAITVYIRADYEGAAIGARYLQRCPRQYFCHLAAHPPATILQDISPDCGEMQNAAVLLPPAPPSDRHDIVGPRTRTWPSRACPVGCPTSRTSASRDTIGSAFGQGCPTLHVPSNSLAAMPDNRMRGPSAHQIGPSPSHTRVGVHWND